MVPLSTAGKVFYRGTRGHPGDPFVSMLDTPSFVEDPRIASVYSHRIGGNSYRLTLTPVGSVHPVRLDIRNPLKLSWPNFSNGLLDLYDLLGNWRFGKAGGATPEDVRRILWHTKRRWSKQGGEHMKLIVYTDREAEEVDNDSNLYFDQRGGMRFERPIDRFYVEWKGAMESDASTKDFEALAYRVKVDAFAVCDTNAFREVSVRLGFDGCYHDDVMEPLVLEAAGFNPSDFDTVNDDDGDECVTYVTWRPFFPEKQVRSIWA